MTTELIKIGKSTVYCDKPSDRLYLMKLHNEDSDSIVQNLNSLAEKLDVSKIFAKIPLKYCDIFIKNGFKSEANIPYFYGDKAKDTAVFISRFIKPEREFLDEAIAAEIAENVNIAIQKSKNPKDFLPELDAEFNFIEADESYAEKLAELYKIVFPSYPFPIDKPEYLKKAMKNGIYFFAVESQGKLVAASSAETDEDSLSCEMTDFATLPEFNGKGLSNYLLIQMENFLQERKYRTAFTIARSHSPAMNITFARNRYDFCGTLINNTNIFGKIESMNVWAKPL